MSVKYAYFCDYCHARFEKQFKQEEALRRRQQETKQQKQEQTQPETKQETEHKTSHLEGEG